MLQPIQTRYPGTGSSASGLNITPHTPHVGFPPEDQSADESSMSGHRPESPQYEVLPEDDTTAPPFTTHQPCARPRPETEHLRQRANGGQHFSQPAQQMALVRLPGPNTNRQYNQNITNVSLTVNATINASVSPKLGRYPQQLGHLGAPGVRPRPVMSPCHPAFSDSDLLLDDRSVSNLPFPSHSY